MISIFSLHFTPFFNWNLSFSLIRSEKLKVMKKETITENKTMSDSTGTLENKLGETREPHLSFCLCPCLLLGNICHLTCKQRASVLLGSLMINLDVENRGLSQEIIVFELLEYVRLFQNLNRLRIYLLRFCGHSSIKGMLSKWFSILTLAEKENEPLFIKAVLIFI